MKKLLSTLSAGAVAALIATNCLAAPMTLAYDGALHEYTGKIYNLLLNGEEVSTNVPPVVLNDRTLVPARAIFEKLGAEVEWDEADKKVLVKMNSSNVELEINNKKALVNDKVVEMDVPAKIINDRTMLPVRFVAEQLNMKVDWKPEDNLIAINSAKVKSITHKSSKKQDDVTIALDYYNDYRILRFDPARIVVDFPNIDSSYLPQRIDVNGDAVKSIRFADFEDPNTGFKAARVVLDVYPESEYEIKESEGELVLAVTNQSEAPKATPSPSPTATPKPTVAPSPTAKPGEPTTKPDSTPAATPEPTATPVPVPTIIPDPSLDTPPEIPVPPQDVDIEPGDFKGMLSVGSIRHTKGSSLETVEINLENYEGYRVVRVTDKDRIVIDIPNIATSSKEEKISVGSNLLNSIRFAQFQGSTARIVLDMKGQSPYEVEEDKGILRITLTPSTHQNIFYHSNGDRVYFQLPGIALTSSAYKLDKYYTGEYSSDGKQYIMTFSKDLADLGTGVVKIDDSYLESIEIQKDDAANVTKIIFNAKMKLIYETVARYNYNTNALIDTAITLLKPPAKGEKLVVIDPGHGGFETGAASGGLIEKKLNLDIAARLNNLLKAKGINTYMIRQSDIYIDLYERAYIANTLDATLFLSVHNNAFNSSTSGTESLYFPPSESDTGFNSKTFAQIVQNKLIDALGTRNRGIIERPGLVVLNRTDMPAVLAEIGFIDNPWERALLNDPEFRQKAAQALCDAIVEALEQAD